MSIKDLTRKTFLTKDSKGCEFECQAFYNHRTMFNPDTREFYTMEENLFKAMGFETSTLKELQDIIGNL